tara:strand:- start:438 stop:695 length:258 start_codon:yes stop_codon:yes gene_type:complete
MNRKNRIESILLNNFKKWKIEVIDNSADHAGHNNFDGSNETHFKLILKNNYYNIQDRLEIHKTINLLLKKEFSSGLHALEIKISN